MSKIRVELFVAWPPTSLCVQLMDLTKRVTREFGDRVEVNIYQRGQAYPVQPTTGFMRVRKTIKLPAVLVDGELLAERDLPDEQKFRTAIRRAARRSRTRRGNT